MTKRIAALTLAVFLLSMLCCVFVAAAPGAAMAAIHIQTPEDLAELAENCRLDTWSQGRLVVLDNDLDLSGLEFTPVPTFGGTFQGNGHTIRGLVLTGDLSHAGFFRYLQEGAVVENLHLMATVTPAGNQSAVGGLVGTNYGAIRNCSVSGVVAGSANVGGLVGVNEESGSISGCFMAGSVSGETYTGGIVGYHCGTLSDCTNDASVNISITRTDISLDELNLDQLNSAENVPVSTDTGGIAGYSSGVVQDSANYGEIGYPHYGYNVGGVVGRQSGFLTGCTNYGNVCGRKEVGGIVGQMEPHMEIQVSTTLAEELQTLHDLVEQAMIDAGAEVDEITAALDQVHASAGSAFDSASSLANQTTDLVSDTVDDINEIASRIDYTIQALAPVTADLSSAASETSAAADGLNAAMDTLEMDEATLDSLRTNLDELSAAMKDIEVAADYLAYLGAAYHNAENQGNTNLDDMRPENYEEIQAEYGYDYTITKKRDIKDAYIKPVSDLIAAAGRATKANSALLDILNEYYLTDIYDADEDGEPDQNRLEAAGASGNAAMDALSRAGTHLDSAVSGLSALNAYLAGQEQIQFSKPDSTYSQTTDALFRQLSDISGGLSALGGVVREGSAAVQADFLAINDQFNRVMLLVVNAITGDTETEILQDVSLEDTEADTEGKTSYSVNYGAVSGDINAGGICGAQAIEYDYDLESDITGGLAGANRIFSSTYLTRCIIRGCENRGAVTAKKDGAGGISALMELGAVLDSGSYGAVSSTDGKNVGGIAGCSYTEIRNCYAMCALAGRDHVGGIAGTGHNISGCYSLIGVDQIVACTGAIAGEADGTLEENFFVHDVLGGVDGISYAGAAEPISYQQLRTRSEVPDEFRQLTLTFVAEGETVKVITFSYGESIAESEIPEVPEKEGYTGSWPAYNYERLRFSDTIEASYISHLTTLASEQTGEEKALVLVEGQFGPNASLLVSASTAAGPGEEAGTLLEQWIVQIDSDLETDGETHTIRYRMPETERAGAAVRIYVRQDGAWTPVTASARGSYLAFDAEGNTVEFCAVESGTRAGWYVGAAIGVGGLLLCVAVFGGKRRKKRKRLAAMAAVQENANPEEPAAVDEDTAAK